MVFYDFLFCLKNFLFPSVCALCGADFSGADEIRFGLCRNCRAFVPVKGEKCNLCGKPLIAERERCLPCRNAGSRSFDRLWTLFPYTGKYRKMLTAYKFGKNLPLAEFLAEKVMEVINSEPLFFKDAKIVPVPPRPGKIKMSGWDQVDYLVKRLEKNGNVQISRCLERKKSKVQKRLNRTERIENMKGRISINGVPPKTALIIDDVITTGSTMEVCASVLKTHGAEKVYGLCLFYD
jgi:ComF family protein